MARPESIDLARVLGSLKDFQRRSVDYVFEQLYGTNSTRRFLLADEVGLGKTLVARGVIARAIEHLRSEGVRRIDIVYICSNADIARQNINRLNVTGRADFQLASRVTLLPTQIQELERNELNFVSFTPGTSFDLRSSTGIGRERWMLYWLLRWTWPSISKGTGAMNVMQANMSRERFRGLIRDYDPNATIDQSLAREFSKRLKNEDRRARQEGRPTFKKRYRDLCRRFRYSRKHVPEADRLERNAFIGELRSLLAATCVQALEPDLIILDEFQRFKYLLRPDDPAGSLARYLFTWGEARLLLLSATPYKMYTLSHESAEDNHYADFLDTLRFLLDDPERTAQVEQLLAEYRRAIYGLGRHGLGQISNIKTRLQNELRRVIARTERLAVAADRNGMLREVCGQAPRLTTEHVHGYLDIQRVARVLDQHDVLEYWKSAPYLLSFMERYQIKRALRRQVSRGGGRELAEELSRSPRSVLPFDNWKRYERIDPCNPQVQMLTEQTLDRGWWRLLWVPPSLPYYKLGTPFAEVDAGAVTKHLVFSSWHVVPRALAALLSYEADRRMVHSFEPTAINTSEARERRRPLLTFTRSQGRLTGMPLLAILYPSTVLADLGDPLVFLNEGGGRDLISLGDVLARVITRVRESITPFIKNTPTSGSEDESWYWVTPILLDAARSRKGTRSWFEDIDALAEAWATAEVTDAGDRWRDHLREARKVAYGQWLPKGRPPEDLVDVIALLAIAGPGVCALRALGRIIGNATSWWHDPVRHAAGRIAWGFRSLFNVPEVMALLRGMNNAEPYWRRVLEYCAAGCLQSVLDEYLHVLREGMGLLDHGPEEAASELAAVSSAAIGMRVATPGVDRITVRDDGRTISIDNQRVRTRFAMRFGQERIEYGNQRFRADQVRQAFNSPFWPFVLATTSIGQEGLDFHPYCHVVVHWNLPSNPVDLEQREGRVHRYKGHAVRKNLARKYAQQFRNTNSHSDPWVQLFELACAEEGRESDLNPFWVYPVENGATIERHVPALPFSRESARLPALRRSLAVYRMVFGQPRQDDLIDHILRHVEPNQWAQVSEDIRIDLTPPPESANRTT